MIKRDVEIQLENGLEARPVAMLVQLASQFESEIHIESVDRKVNAKSIMGMMTLGLGNGEMVAVYANGGDEEKAVEGIANYLASQK
jgi:Phosphotransferase System HPr (HPr) Family